MPGFLWILLLCTASLFSFLSVSLFLRICAVCGAGDMFGLRVSVFSILPVTVSAVQSGIRFNTRAPPIEPPPPRSG